MRTLTVAAATWREAVRQPVSIIVLCIAAVVTFLSQFVNFYHLSEEVGYNVIRQMAVAQTLICGIVICVFTASAALADEIESRTILTLLAKPVRRHEIILGKFLGIMAAIAMAFAIMVAVSLATAWWTEAEMSNAGRLEKWRANPGLVVTELPALTTGQGTLQVSQSYAELVSRKSAQGLDYLQSVGDFLMLSSGQTTQLVARAPLSAELERAPDPKRHSASAGHSPASSPGVGSFIGNVLSFVGGRTGVLLQAFALAFAHVMVFAAIAVAVSTRLPLVFNALFCSAIFVLGNVSRQLGQALMEADAGGGLGTRIATWPLIGLCYLLPNLENLSLTDPLATGIGHIGPSVWIYGVLYGIVYTAIVLAVAVLLFRRREVS